MHLCLEKKKLYEKLWEMENNVQKNGNLTDI